MKRFKKNIIKTRIMKLSLLAFLAFTFLSIRLYYIQIIKSNTYKKDALSQRSKEVVIYPDRGTVYDRNLIPLTNKRRESSLYVYREDLQKKEVGDYLNKYLGINKYEINELLMNEKGILELPLEKEVKLPDPPKELYIIDKTLRYDHGDFLSHVIGYVKKSENAGAYGIEKVFDDILKNQENRSVFFEFDGKKNLIPGGGYVSTKNKKNSLPSGVKLTIDYHIQKIIEESIDKDSNKGAIIVADVETGDILAMTSRPNFDQNVIDSYFNKDNMELYNKAIQVSYPPGSLFKIVVLLSALEENPSIIYDNYYCRGYEEIGDTLINCNKQEGHGNLTLNQGFAYSCNSVFIQIGKEIGSEKIIDMAEKLGFGKKVNIGLLEEVEGNLPKERELLGPAIGNISLGQGNIEATPLQITNMMMVVANNGIRKDISIIDSIVSEDGKLVKDYNRNEDERIINESNSKILKEYLEDVVDYGTGRSIGLDEIGGAGGKTGSAEGVINKKNTIHGWFSGYYPKNNPKYVVTVFIEDDYRGSSSAVPIFQEVIKEINKIKP